MRKIFLFLAILQTFLYAKDYPLLGYANGFEFNFPRVFASNDSERGIAGTYSYFDFDNGVEYAFPWTFSRVRVSRGYMSDANETKESYFYDHTIDFHYRKFLSQEFNGFYLSGFSRVAYLKGVVANDKNPNENKIETELKLGLGVGIGYRFFPKSQRFYWGASLSIGRFIIGENDKFIARDMFNVNDDPALIVDIEFLKFGYAF